MLASNRIQIAHRRRKTKRSKHVQLSGTAAQLDHNKDASTNLKFSHPQHVQQQKRKAKINFKLLRNGKKIKTHYKKTSTFTEIVFIIIKQVL